MAGRHMQFLGLFHHSVIWNKWLVYNRAPMVWLATRQPPLPPHPPWFCCQHPAGRPWLGAARSHTRPIWGSTGPSYTGCLPPTCQLELLLQPLLPVLLGEWLMHISPNYWDASRQVRQTSRLIPSVHIGLVLPKLGQWGLTGSTLLQEVPQKDGSKPQEGGDPGAAKRSSLHGQEKGFLVTPSCVKVPCWGSPHEHWSAQMVAVFLWGHAAL